MLEMGALLMGVDYTQKCILGIELDASQLLKVVEPTVTEEQPRYDTKTGEVTRYETVVVKKGIEVYSYLGVEGEDLWCFAEELAEKLHMDFDVDEDELIYLGFFVGDSPNWGYCRAHLIEGSVSLEHLNGLKEELEEKLQRKDIELHFLTHVG